MKLTPEDLIFNEEKGYYSLPCGAFTIHYIQMDWSSEDCWAAIPTGTTKTSVYDAFLSDLCDRLTETYPEYFTNLYKILHYP